MSLIALRRRHVTGGKPRSQGDEDSEEFSLSESQYPVNCASTSSTPLADGQAGEAAYLNGKPRSSSTYDDDDDGLAGAMAVA